MTWTHTPGPWRLDMGTSGSIGRERLPGLQGTVGTQTPPLLWSSPWRCRPLFQARKTLVHGVFGQVSAGGWPCWEEAPPCPAGERGPKRHHLPPAQTPGRRGGNNLVISKVSSCGLTPTPRPSVSQGTVTSPILYPVNKSGEWKPHQPWRAG